MCWGFVWVVVVSSVARLQSEVAHQALVGMPLTCATFQFTARPATLLNDGRGMSSRFAQSVSPWGNSKPLAVPSLIVTAPEFPAAGSTPNWLDAGAVVVDTFRLLTAATAHETSAAAETPRSIAPIAAPFRPVARFDIAPWAFATAEFHNPPMKFSAPFDEEPTVSAS